MKRWPNGISNILFEEAASGDGEGSRAAGEAPKTFNINGKDIPVEQLASALQLHNALADPEIGKEIIGTMAQRMGLLDKKGELKGGTNETERKLEGRVQKLLKSKFGKEYEKFADTLGPVMDEAIQEYLAEHKAGVEEASGAVGWEGEVERFTDNHTLTTDVERKMEELITRNGGIPKGLKGKAAQEYLTDMYELAVHRLGIKAPDNEEQPERRNRRGRDEAPEFREQARPKGPLSLDDIVDAAMKGIRFR